MKTSPGTSGSTLFRRLGSFVYRRRRYVVVAWVIILLAVLPIVINASKSTSLQLGSASGSQLESVKASEVIEAQFAKSVPNSTLLLVISGRNVSSVDSQILIRDLASAIRSDKSIVGLTRSLDVYSKLYATIESLNHGAFSAMDGANLTVQLLLGVPALFVNTWEQAYASSGNVAMADAVANSTVAKALYMENSTAFEVETSRLLSLFYSSWNASWTNPEMQGLNVTSRASYSAWVADMGYLQTFGGHSSAFERAVVSNITESDFLSDTNTQLDSRLQEFAVGYVSKDTGLSTTLVASTLSLGRGFDNASMYMLAGDIVWKPAQFDVGEGLSELISSFVSPSRNLTIVSLGLNQSSNQNLLAIRSLAASAMISAAPAAGVNSILVTGQDAISYDFGNSIQADITIIFTAAIILLIVATGLFFRSVLTPFITMGTIGVALGISQVFIVLASTFVVKVDFTVPAILLTVLIGVGTDYSVFVMARYREERVRGRSVQEAVEISVTWAGESIATSGATVIISFLALGLTSIVLLRAMGVVVGLGVLVALGVALTLVPAVTGIAGEHAFWPTSGEKFSKYASNILSKLARRRGYFSKSGAFAVKRAKVLIVVAVLVTAPAVYVYSTTIPTYDFLSAAPSSLQSISASNQIGSAFGKGWLFPTYVAVTVASPLVTGHSFNATEFAAISAISDHLASYQFVSNVTSPSMPYGITENSGASNYSSASGERTFTAIMTQIGRNNRSALITVDFSVNPFQTEAISEAQNMRQYLHNSLGAGNGLTGLYLGGSTGSILDTKNTFDAEFDSVVPIVAIGVALVLLAVLGSLFLSVFAVLSVLMSIVWTIGATKLFFQTYFNYQILFITPFFLFVTLLGLGMDYNIFILTRIREEATKDGALNDAIIRAIEQTGGIITAAAIILAGSLGALMLSSDLLLKEMGFSFAYSILIDALVVRTYLVPAVMSVMGKWNWYNPIPYLNRSKSLFKKGNGEAL